MHLRLTTPEELDTLHASLHDLPPPQDAAPCAMDGTRGIKRRETMAARFRRWWSEDGAADQHLTTPLCQLGQGRDELQEAA